MLSFEEQRRRLLQPLINREILYRDGDGVLTFDYAQEKFEPPEMVRKLVSIFRGSVDFKLYSIYATSSDSVKHLSVVNKARYAVLHKRDEEAKERIVKEQLAERQMEYTREILQSPVFKQWWKDMFMTQVDPFASMTTYYDYTGMSGEEILTAIETPIDIIVEPDEDLQLFSELFLRLCNLVVQSYGSVKASFLPDCGFSIVFKNMIELVSRISYDANECIITIGKKLGIAEPQTVKTETEELTPNEPLDKRSHCIDFCGEFILYATDPRVWVKLAYLNSLRRLYTVSRRDSDRVESFLDNNLDANLSKWLEAVKEWDIQGGDINPCSSTFIRVLKVFSAIVLFYTVDNAPKEVMDFFLSPKYTALNFYETRYAPYISLVLSNITFNLFR